MGLSVLRGLGARGWGMGVGAGAGAWAGAGGGGWRVWGRRARGGGWRWGGGWGLEVVGTAVTGGALLLALGGTLTFAHVSGRHADRSIGQGPGLIEDLQRPELSSLAFEQVRLRFAE